MASEGFYLTFMSNSSFQHFPENKTSSFSVKLPRTINLDGAYEVALCELTFPNTIDNVTTNNNEFVIEIKSQYDENPVKIHEHKFKIEEGYYNTVDELIDALNYTIVKSVPGLDETSDIKVFNHVSNKLVLNRDKFQKVLDQIYTEYESVETITTLKKYSYTNDLNTNELESEGESETEDQDHHRVIQLSKAYFKGRLALQLGYEPNADIVSMKPNHHTCISFGRSESILIYLNVLEPQLINDIEGQVVKIVQSVGSNEDFGDVCVRTFFDRNYMPVMTKSFDTISVDIRESAGGGLVPFTFGNLYGLLHFRKK